MRARDYNFARAVVIDNLV